jgi:hypothetical protein
MPTDFVHRGHWVIGERDLRFNPRPVPYPGDIESLLDEVEQRLRKPHRMIIAAQTMRHVRHLLGMPGPGQR